MTISPILDVASGYYYLIFGGAMLVILALAVAAEGLILYFLGYKPIMRSMVDSLVANLVSGLAGFALALLMGESRFDGAEIQVLLLLFGMTVLIEGGVLTLLRKKETSFKTVWLGSLLMNVASYGFIFGYFMVEGAL